MTNITKKLKVNFKRELGKGLRSTVFEGKFEDIPVAVKRIKCKEAEDELSDLRERKIMNRIEKERHHNIVGYYVSEIDDDFLYIAMELCDGHLGKYVKRADLQVSYPPIRVEKDIIAGLEFLHSKGIAHRDIKPENIYFVLKQNSISKFVIGDYGTSKVTVEEWFSISMSIGTTGYISYEVWEETRQMQSDTNCKGRMNKKSDIFALGCVIYFIESGGQHPFGTPMDRQANIVLKKPPEITLLMQWQDPLKQLIARMLSHKAEERPVAHEIAKHPAFWSGSQKIDFLTSVSDVLYSSDYATRCEFENPDVIWRGNWTINIPVNLATYLESYVSNGRHIYTENRNTVYGFLRTIRNVTNHYKSFPKKAQEELGVFPDGHVLLWETLCPRILMHIYQTASNMNLSDVVYPYENVFVTDRSELSMTTNSENRTSVGSTSSLALLKEHSFSTESDYRLLSDHTNPKLVWDTPSSSSLANTSKLLSPFIRSETGNQEKALPAHQYSQPEIEKYRNQDATSSTYDINKLSITTSSYSSRSAQTTGLPEIVKQKKKLYKPDVQNWSMYAHEEIEVARQYGLKDVGRKHIILCIDISESMALEDAWKHVGQFVNDVFESFSALSVLLGDRQSEYIAISTFGHETKVAKRFTRNVDELRSTIGDIKLGGPSPMFGGIMLALAAAGTPGGFRALPTIVILSDLKPTETLCYAGPDEMGAILKEEIEDIIDTVCSQVLEILLQFKERADIVFVPVGNYDKDFLKLAVEVSGCRTLQYADGRQLITDILQTTSQEMTSKDMYNENQDSDLPVIGSRVARGPDWKWEDQDSAGPGTVIGHEKDHSLWVEWDKNGKQNIYRYGFCGEYDLILIDDGRAISKTGTLGVGCFVTHDNRGSERGVVIKKLNNGKLRVRWENGERGDYSFDQNDTFEIWPWDSSVCPRRQAEVCKDASKQDAQTLNKRINKNEHRGTVKRK